MRSNVKVTLTVFFNSCGVVHHEYAPEGQNIIKEYYLEVIRRLSDAMQIKIPNIWAKGTWHFRHDNAPVYSLHQIQTFPDKHSIPQVPHLST